MQAKREAQIQAAHDAAIFGPFTGLSSKKTGSYGKESHDSPTKETTTDDDAVVQPEAAPPINNLLSDQVNGHCFTFDFLLVILCSILSVPIVDFLVLEDSCPASLKV